MIKKAFSGLILTALLLMLVSCKTDVYRSNYTSRLEGKTFTHQDKHFLFKMPEDWDFVKTGNELDTILKFSSGNKKINGYLKRYKFRKNAYNLDTVIGDYFLKRPKCHFTKIYKGRKRGRTYFILSGFFRSVYPIVSLVTLHSDNLYELTMVEAVDKNDIEKNKINAMLETLNNTAFSVFSSIKFYKKEKAVYRQRYGFKVICPKGWELENSSLDGEIASLGYKNKIVVLSLKLIKDTGSEIESNIQKDINKLILEFKKTMKKKNFNIYQEKTSIFGIKADLVIVSNITVEIKNSSEVTTGIVKKYIFHKNGKIYEFLYLYSAKDINNNIKLQAEKIIKSIEYTP